MRVRTDDAELEVAVGGEGVPLVLLHGFPFSSEIWRATTPALGATARTIAIDLRGMGRSSVPPGPYLMEVLAGDVLTVLDELAVDRAILVGHSYGSYVAFAFARMFAERLAGLAIVCGRADAESAAGARHRRSLAVRVEAEGIDAALDGFAERFFAPATREAHPEIVARARELAARTDPLGAAATLRGIAERVPATDFLEEIAVPALVVAGEADAVMSHDHAHAIAAALPRGRCETLPCGHLPMFETPDALAALLAGLTEDADADAA